MVMLLNFSIFLKKIYKLLQVIRNNVYLHSQNKGKFNSNNSLKIWHIISPQKKRIRQTEARRVQNKYAAKTTRNAVRKLRSVTDKKEAEKLFPEVASMLDKLAKNNVIHHKKAANLKSSLAVQLNKMQ